jgi:hypothetical protein
MCILNHYHTSLLLSLCAFSATALADDGAFVVRPAEIFQHEVEVSLEDGPAFRSISIIGPRLHSQMPECETCQNVSSKHASYNWYKIVGSNHSLNAIQPKDVTFKWNGDNFRIERPAYLLTPATILQQSAADAGPDDSNVLLAFQLSLKKSAADPHKPPKVRFVCIAVRQRHHDEIYEISSPDCGYLLSQIDSHELTGEINTVDQFGLHRVKRLRTAYRLESIPQLSTQEN